MIEFDIIVVGAGTAGLPCAIFGARAGARVLLLEKDADIGGTLHISSGHISAAGARRQKALGIEDSIDDHFDDIDRISDGTVREDLVGTALRHAAWLIDWLEDEGFEFAPGTPSLIPAHEPYSTPRTFYGVDEARSVLKVFRKLLQPLVDSGAVTLALGARVKALLTDKDEVIGVQYAQDGQVRQARARKGVVLATGGFAASPELFKEIERQPLVSAARETSTGEGLLMAQGVGGVIAGRGAYLPTFGGIPHPEDPHKASWKERPRLNAKERPPHEIYVDRFGKRWVAEDEPSIDRKEHALMRTDGLTFFMVFDDAAIDASPDMIAGWSKQDLRERAGTRAGVHVAPTLDELARVAGIDEEGLRVTVDRYNGYVGAGADPDFGRRFLPAPIEKGPFYAIRNHGIALITFSGIDVDSSLQVRRDDGSVIRGLYAAGEILGGHATSGNAFCSGMMLGPAIIFGRLIGERLGLEAKGTDEFNRPRA